MSAEKVKVEFFFDVMSPYSYIGFEIIMKYKEKWKTMDLHLQPMLLAAVMVAQNNVSPGMLPARGKYLGRDLLRLSEFYGIPFKQPNNIFAVFEKGSLLAQRLATLVITKYADKAESLVRGLFHMVFQLDIDITNHENLVKTCTNAGFTESEAKELLREANEQEFKDMLKAQTDKALSFGAFGAPTIVAYLKNKNPAMFFGSDRIFLLAHYLDEKWEGNIPFQQKL